ncbi:hypothetical protein CDEST_08551 [Colletotrichum destructivum]|uniref:Uncharacterized protein n=1 Tax=Colletotrichum destructivum TaxID=34406 RepID=A0AAX4IJW5_9PEZI|nr:hypothetical protein CDEST_08551 [Colletotrichum destructivum]
MVPASHEIRALERYRLPIRGCVRRYFFSFFFLLRATQPCLSIIITRHPSRRNPSRISTKPVAAYRNITGGFMVIGAAQHHPQLLRRSSQETRPATVSRAVCCGSRSQVRLGVSSLASVSSWLVKNPLRALSARVKCWNHQGKRRGREPCRR